jgi:hypothetical protein
VQTILKFLKKGLTEPGMDTSDWDTRLSEILLGYRASNHSSTGFSPALLTYGRELLLPAQLLAEAAAKQVDATAAQAPASSVKSGAIDLCSSEDSLAHDGAVQAHLQHAREVLEAAVPDVLDNIASAQQKQVLDYRKRHKDQLSAAERMPLNSFVSMKVPQASKLDTGLEGPYKVVSYDQRGTTATIEDAEGRQWTRHVSLIAPYTKDH